MPHLCPALAHAECPVDPHACEQACQLTDQED